MESDLHPRSFARSCDLLTITLAQPMRSLRFTLLLSFFMLALAAPLFAQRLHRYPVVSVTSTSVTYRIWYELGGRSTVRFATDSTFAGASRTVSSDVSPNGVLQGTVSELTPSTRYYYRVENSDGAAISPVFSFKTFPEEGRDADATILFGSCQQSHVGDAGKTFDVAATLGGDLFVQLGDWGYPDHLIAGYPTAPGTIEQSYELRLDTNYPFARKILSQMGVAYIWDDHDWAENNGHGAIDPTLKQQLLAAYTRHIPHYPLQNPQHGIWQSFMIGNVEFFMIDDRSQRSPIDSAFTGASFNPPPGHSMLAGLPVTGIDQRTWLLNAIRSSKARWKVLVSQVFFNPATSPLINLALIAGRRDLAIEFADKWIGYPADIDSLRRLFQQGYGRNFLIISGDAHSNVYDNGSHSLVPEFMVGNLDKENSNLYTLLKSYGFDIWTAGQSDSASTIGRIRIETTPRHRLIVESFNEKGERVLSYEMVDSSSSSTPRESGSAWSVRHATIDGNILTIAMENPPIGIGTLELFNIAGASVHRSSAMLDSNRELRLVLRSSLPSGTYVGRIDVRGDVRSFRVEVMK